MYCNTFLKQNTVFLKVLIMYWQYSNSIQDRMLIAYFGQSLEVILRFIAKTAALFGLFTYLETEILK